MRNVSSHSTKQELSPAEQWPLLCLKELKGAQFQSARVEQSPQSERSSLGEDEGMYAQGLLKIDQAYYGRHPGICNELVAVVRNRSLSDRTRATAVTILTRHAEVDPNLLAYQIARAERRQADRGEAPALPSPYVVMAPKSHSLAMLNLLDDRTESTWLRQETKQAFDYFKRRCTLGRKL
jgi:hypothetical protein